MNNAHEPRSLGPCCVCGTPGATVLHLLNAQCPLPGKGWGCFQCDIESHGALAVVCESCAALAETSATPAGMLEDLLRFVCRGNPGSDGRMPIADLRGEHAHDQSKHPEATQTPSMTVLASDTRFGNYAEEGQGCHCSRCGQTIWEGTVALRAFAEHGDWEYRYHGTCFFGALPIYEDFYEAAWEELEELG